MGEQFPILSSCADFEIVRAHFSIDELQAFEKQLAAYEDMTGEEWELFLDRNGGFAPPVVCWFEGLQDTSEFINSF